MATEEKDLSIPAIVIVDCSNREDLSINSVKAFPDTKEGKVAARKLFDEWVREAAGDEFIDDDAMLSLWNEGKYEVGSGYIACLTA